MPNEFPIDHRFLDDAIHDDEEDPLLSEGRAAYSWEKFDTPNANEGWGHADPSHRKRRRRYEGDELD